MKKKGPTKTEKPSSTERTVKVLYQNIGGEVYAFTHVDGEVYFAKVPVTAHVESGYSVACEKDAA